MIRTTHLLVNRNHKEAQEQNSSKDPPTNDLLFPVRPHLFEFPAFSKTKHHLGTKPLIR